MISAQEAFRLVLARRTPLRAENIFLVNSLGKVLAEDIFSDLDQPPFHRVSMDGIAVRRSDLERNCRLKVLGIVAAGASPGSLPEGKVCFEIMTGAALPCGADFIVRYEDLKIDNGYAQLVTSPEGLDAHIHPQGSDYKKGDRILAEGTTIRSTQSAILASVGRTMVKVYTCPLVGILSTGDELVEIEAKPGPHQIRWSNGICLMHELHSFGITNVSIHKVADDEALIREKIKELLNCCDLLLLTGGVSAGKFDYVPKILKECGVTEVFHKVAQRPGLPLWFGTRGTSKLVLGLPGNPVSCLVNLRKYVVPLVLPKEHLPRRAVLGADVNFNKDLAYYCPVKVQDENGTLVARPLSGNGSGDFFQLRDSDGFIELCPQSAPFKKGQAFDLYLWGEVK